MGKRFVLELDPREGERDDCEHYPECLTLTAKTGRGRGVAVPCERCDRYVQAEPEEWDAWRKSGSWNPDSGV